MPHPAPEEFEGHRITAAAGRGAEPMPPVSIHPHMVYGSGLTDPLDYVVLLHILFMSAAGQSLTVADVLEALRAEEIRSGNGSGPVGRDAVYRTVKNLLAAGFLRRVQQGKPGKFGAVAYEVYQHPEYNPSWPTQSTKPQVAPLTAMPDTGSPAETGKAAGRAAYGNAGHGNAGHGNAGHGAGHKTAGRTAYGNAGHGSESPPTPPRGGGKTSPLPPTERSASGNTATGEEEDVRSARNNGDGHSSERLTAAADFLRGLPDDVTPNAKQRAKLAPLLLDQIDGDGWEFGPELLHALSVSQDGRPAKNRFSVVKFRIEHLPPPPRRPETPEAPAADDTDRCPHHPSRTLQDCPCQRAEREEGARARQAVEGPQKGTHARAGADALKVIEAAFASQRSAEERRPRRRATHAQLEASRLAEEERNRQLAEQLNSSVQ